MDNMDKLAVVWTSGDKEVAEKVVFLYTQGAKTQGWFDEVVLIVWGPSARMLAGDVSLQKKVVELMDAGVTVRACRVCTEQYGVTSELEVLGLDVLPMGGPLTDYLKEDWKVLTF
ncbi:MAG: DsrE family protein [Marinilabilia sp.]